MADRPASRWLGYLAALLLVAATVGTLKLVPHLSDATAALILLLAIFFCAWLWEGGPGVLAALLATLSFNFFFISPLHTFSIDDPRNIVAFVVFLASALVIGRLSAVSRHRLRLVEAERRDLAALTQLSQAFLSDTTRESLLNIACDRLRQALVCDEVAILLAVGSNGLTLAAATPQAQVDRERAEAAYRQRSSVVVFPSDLGGTDIYLPILVGLERAGALVARGLRTSERMAEGCAMLLGLALERERFVSRARAAEETKTSEEMKSTLLAALAHDLKTPVATARAALENWEAAAGGSDKSRLAREQLQALTRRIEELMQVVRLDSGAALPRRERVSCSEIVEASISRFGETLRSHGLSLDVPAEVRIDVDPVQVAEALGHGLENAARYSPAGSEIRVSVEEAKDSVVLRVADFGKGIPLPDRDRVLERFVRLPNSAGVPGSGLGLAIARSLVELNGGHIRIGGTPEGGALFEMTFPRGRA